jgi:hypothetical protein
VKLAVVDQAARVSRDRRHVIHVQKLAVVHAEILAVPVDHDLAGPRSRLGKSGPVKGDPRDAKGFLPPRRESCSNTPVSIPPVDYLLNRPRLQEMGLIGSRICSLFPWRAGSGSAPWQGGVNH